MPSVPPLSLYLHLPWCVRKCPYCDFNSHGLDAELPHARYVDALLRDLELEATHVPGREIETIFLGGGTPSLFPPEAIARLLEGVRTRVPIAAGAEITLEANPGTVDNDRFRGFRQAGINRLSIGVQSFDEEKLKALGRIHGREEAARAADAARVAGFDNFNLDLMYGLPGQDVEQCLADIRTAIGLAPSHLSVYQLTLEPNTLFYARPPVLPAEQAIDAMQETLVDLLAQQGFVQYEVSAYAQPGRQCRHNRNYWEFGDYLGIGAGAHGKITSADGIVRTTKPRHPETYQQQAGTVAARSERRVPPQDIAFEFALNALRLCEGFSVSLYRERTALDLDAIAKPLKRAREQGLLAADDERIQPTPLGRRFLNDLLLLFLPENSAA